ncbi:hypothetical protein [Thermosulfurimonas sp. F29]|uniref:hypothetical protein n=1 Tax=Thermosulfurimonas sp. F29 TaxID=2867247 RepID=UPI001C8368E8|nr:hypothetical protein [Thermosulfurimonas sp. F29]MBX6423378.1 hypothetical protein [Thermosulfurimonas sp. F29]
MQDWVKEHVLRRLTNLAFKKAEMVVGDRKQKVYRRLRLVWRYLGFSARDAEELERLWRSSNEQEPLHRITIITDLKEVFEDSDVLEGYWEYKQVRERIRDLQMRLARLKLQKEKVENQKRELERRQEQLAEKLRTLQEEKKRIQQALRELRQEKKSVQADLRQTVQELENLSTRKAEIFRRWKERFAEVFQGIRRKRREKFEELRKEMASTCDGFSVLLEALGQQLPFSHHPKN